MYKTMKRIAAASAFVAMTVVPAHAETFTDSDLMNYAQVNGEIVQVRDQTFESLDDEAAQHSLIELKASMQVQIDEIIESSALSQAEYDSIQLALRDDADLRARYDELVAQ